MLTLNLLMSVYELESAAKFNPSLLRNLYIIVFLFLLLNGVLYRGLESYSESGRAKEIQRKRELRKRDRTQVTNTLSDKKKTENRQSKTDKYPRYGARLVSVCLRHF